MYRNANKTRSKNQRKWKKIRPEKRESSDFQTALFTYTLVFGYYYYDHFFFFFYGFSRLNPSGRLLRSFRYYYDYCFIVLIWRVRFFFFLNDTSAYSRGNAGSRFLDHAGFLCGFSFFFFYGIRYFLCKRKRKFNFGSYKNRRWCTE